MLKKPTLNKAIISGVQTFALVVLCSGVYAAEGGGQLQDKDLIVSIKTNGGLCDYGECSAQQKIFRNGSFSRVDGSGNKMKGDVDGYDISHLIDIIEKTDFQLIKSHPFQGTCPPAYDGTKFVYYFYTSHGIEEIDSCEFQIDENHPLFQTLSKVLGSIK